MTGWGAWVVPVAALTLLLLDLGWGAAGQGGGQGVPWAGAGAGHRGRHTKWSYSSVKEKSETRRHYNHWRTPVTPPRHPSPPRAGPPYRPDAEGAGKLGRGRSGVLRGSRRGYNAPAPSWGGVRGGRPRGEVRGRGRRPHHGARPSAGAASTTLGITKYTDRYKAWRGLVHGESTHLSDN